MRRGRRPRRIGHDNGAHCRARPFLYFPLKHHFEQQLHVRHRLERYQAGRYMDIDTSPPDVIANTIADEVGREPHYQPAETDAARRAAAVIAELL
jgi:hypothetical protein